ncbi:unnamed protein product [Mesocestoides corti]|uniref:Morc S5 domain-containing protein n=1 Tax=Mesocestoides corti TaxID=53468 RepID=A0A0R3UA22_MESCO|nr:unnamed protein product [Mesocestoides corti]
MEPHADIQLPPEKRSLRAYVSILYADPRMKVHIQCRKVQTKRLLDTLYAVKRYNFASKTFRTRAERDLANPKTTSKLDVQFYIFIVNIYAYAHLPELRAKEAESKARDCELRYANSRDPEHLKLIRRLSNAAAEMRSLVVMKQNTVARKQKALKDPKTLTFYFGMNVVNRACDGMFVYNCSRLIKMYQRIGPQQDSSMMCRGVVGIVDVPYMVLEGSFSNLEPTHNKQDFADAKEFRQLMRAMADHLMQYWDDLAIDKNGNEDTNRFWKSFGYLSARWRDPPSDEEKYARKRYSCVSLCVQCVHHVITGGCNLPHLLLISTSAQTSASSGEYYRTHKIKLDVMSPTTGNVEIIPTRNIGASSYPDANDYHYFTFVDFLENDPSSVPAHVSVVTREPQHQSNRSSLSNTLNLCDTPEEDMSPPMGVLKRKIKTKEQRQAELEAQIRKKQEELEQILDPDDEPSFRGRASSKRQSRASSPPHQPAKKAHSTAASPTGRTITVADRKRMGSQPTTTPAKSSPRRPPLLKSRQAASVSSRSTVSSDVNQSRSTRVSSSRRIIRDQSSESEEESTAEEDDEEVLREKLNEATVVSTTNNGQAATTFPPFDTTSTAGSGESNTQTKSTLNKDTGDLTAPNELKTPEANAKTSSFIANGEVTKFSPDTTSKRICLRYFLPPQWPMQKDRIHTLTESELADFPLEEFFDRYEQGLRSLLSNFQQETQVFGETLQNLRRDVVRLLDKTAPELRASSYDGDAVDQLLREYLSKNP